MGPLFDAWLQTNKTRVRRLVGPQTHLGLVIALIALIGLISIGLIARSSIAHQALAWIAQHRLIAALSAGVYTLFLVRRQRLHLTLEYTRSWLRAAPFPSRSFVAMTALRVALNVLVQATLVTVLVVSAAVLANQPSTATLWPLLCGLIAGAIVGAVWPESSAPRQSANSRFIFRVQHVAHAPSLDGLSRWPVAHALAWHRPENSRVLFIAAALSVPVGSSAVLGLVILATWSLASYLFALVRAISEVAREAALWLRPTSVAFHSFAWAITRRVLVHQLIGLSVLGSVAIVAGGTFLNVIYFCVLWLLVTAMIALINVRQQFVGMPSLLRTVTAVALVLAAESRPRGWGAVLAMLITIVHLRGSSRVRT
jgi:hypothetical protein